MSPRSVLLQVLVLLPLLAPGAPAAPDGTTVTVHPAGAQAYSGGLLGLEGGEVRLATPGGERKEALEDLRSVEVEGVGPGSLATRPHQRVHLVDGSVLLGLPAGADDEGMGLALPGIGDVRLPFDLVRTVVAVPRDADPCFEPEARLAPRSGGDVAYVEGGDEVQGLLLEADAEGLTFETGRGAERRVPWAALLVLHLENDQAPPREGLSVEVETVEGSRLSLAAPPTLDGDVLRAALQAAPAQPLEIPLAALRAMRPSGGTFVYACHLPFESVFRTPYGDPPPGGIERTFLETWYGTRVDRRPSGCPLRLGGATIRHGFAVHAHATVTIPLHQRYASFACVFGVDDEALEVPRGGVVDARILADGAVRWEAQAVRAGEAPRAVGPLDVSAVQVLVLEVDFGPELHVRDRATWGEPLLVVKAR